MMYKSILFWRRSILAIVAACSFPGVIISCSCNKVDLQEDTHTCDYIFYGEVISSELVGLNELVKDDTIGQKFMSSISEKIENYTIDRTYLKVVIKIDGSLKGSNIDDLMYILTPASSAACGYEFKKGYRYMVFGYSAERSWQNGLNTIQSSVLTRNYVITNLCLSNQLYSPKLRDAIKDFIVAEYKRIIAITANVLISNGLVEEKERYTVELPNNFIEDIHNILLSDSILVVIGKSIDKENIVINWIEDIWMTKINFHCGNLGGEKNSGVIYLSYKDGKWVFQRINYVSSVE